MGTVGAKKIALVASFPPPYFGGMQSHAAEFFRHFYAKGLCKAFIVSKGGSLQEARKVQGFLNSGLVDELRQGSASDSSAIAGKIRENSLQSGIIFFNSPHWMRCFESLKSEFPSIRVFLRSGGNDLLQAGFIQDGASLKSRQEEVARTINRHVDALIVNSQYSKARFEKMGIAPEKMKVIMGGVDCTRFRPGTGLEKSAARKMMGVPQEDILILSAVRFVPFKSVGTTIKAVETANDMLGGKISFVLAGNGPLEAKIRAKAEKTGLDGKLVLANTIPFQRMQVAYWTADIYLQSPIEHSEQVRGGAYVHTETMGRSFCEAAASGIPSVSTAVGGVPEIIDDGRTGFLADQMDVAGLGAKIVAAAEGLKNGAAGMLARAKAELQFSWDKVFWEYERLFFRGG